MKSLLLVLAVPVLLTGCAAYVGDAGPGYYDNGGYYAGGPVYYSSPAVVDVGYYGGGRSYYRRDYHHYDGAYGYHNASVNRTSSFHANNSRVASQNVSRGSVGHSGGGGRGAASASAGHAGGGGGGHSGGGHR